MTVGKDNIECLCLTCEQHQKGGFAPKEIGQNSMPSRSASRDISAAPPNSFRNVKPPSSLRNIVNGQNDNASEAEDKEYEDYNEDTLYRTDTPGPSRQRMAETNTPTPSKDQVKSRPRTQSILDDTESIVSDSEDIDESPRRERSRRLVAKNIKPWAYLRKPKDIVKAMNLEVSGQDDADVVPEDFPRCATCAKPLHERVWYANRYFDHCER